MYDSKKTTLTSAHDGKLSCFALNFDGKRLATASEKGTIIRIFDTETGDKLQEVRRGADQADIYSLAFSERSKWLACSSDKGTIHIFKMDASKVAAKEEEKASKDISNPTSSLSFMSGVLPAYFKSEWSFAQFRVPETRTIVAFGADENSIIVVSADGSFYKAMFDPDKGGECIKEKYAKFVLDSDDEKTQTKKTTATTAGKVGKG